MNEARRSLLVGSSAVNAIEEAAVMDGRRLLRRPPLHRQPCVVKTRRNRLAPLRFSAGKTAATAAAAPAVVAVVVVVELTDGGVGSGGVSLTS